ncbi:FadR/GntR family transcriptional regulator [Paenibacillus whitsoniae]|uniref:FadR family transcriptional regulator n=1 Tax=Paenibacillus whitsoniae TaxID=2496558 RepID=A0A430J7D6_9BACL|nr:FadR/GntR family transcriptional regulator [Paenibacillus whitsoniae]RTE05464.1 FadR family transcriptional regulator [Paenibacillus whitsoniae]
MMIRAIEKQNVVDEVYDQIKSHIITSKWKPGDKIPSENELCQMFNVSRISVRSAIQKLRGLGIITTHHGKGSFVSPSVNEVILNGFFPIMNLSEKEFVDMMEFRETIEFKCIDLAVQRADEQDIQEIGKALQKMLANKDDYVKYSVHDYEFHFNIVKASKNDLFIKLMQVVKEPFSYYLEELNRVFGVSEESLQGHIDQYEAIRTRDAQKAKELIEFGMQENRHKIQQLKSKKS